MEALEADFLQDLYEVRQLKAETSRALHKVYPLAHRHCFCCTVFSLYISVLQLQVVSDLTGSICDSSSTQSTPIYKQIPTLMPEQLAWPATYLYIPP